MQSYVPQEIIVDKAVADKALTKRVLKHFNKITPTYVLDPSALKKFLPMTDAKKKLLITQYQGDIVKTCQGAGGYVCCNYFTVSFVSNCPMECSYCILQDYLKNNPMITLYANIDEIFEGIKATIQKKPDQMFRLGTGELADSLILDDIMGLTLDLVPFVAKQKNLILELKTKSTQINNLLNLNHNGRTVVSWSVNPQKFIDKEEWKTASLDDRLKAARKVADAGYKVGFHCDPLLSFEGWKREYKNLIQNIADLFNPKEIAWVSLGSLRYTPGLKKIIETRFPKSELLLGELFASPDGKVRYLREIREELYATVKGYISDKLDGVPHYLCMETPKVWERVFDTVPQTRDELEESLGERFAI